MMVRIDSDRLRDIPSDLAFVERLVQEEAVLCLPGSCFNCPGFVRLVITSPPEVLEDALQRIADFCHRHGKVEA